ncbi:MAG: dioxygenase, partial [Caldimonas sp.]
MSTYNQDKLTADVVAAFANTPDPRLRQLMTSLVEHLHAFARENDLTTAEWQAGLRFMEETCRITNRPEIIVLSDTLGLSMMVV